MPRLLKRLNPRVTSLLGIQVLFWFATLAQTQRHHLSAWIIVLGGVLLLGNVVSLVFMARTGVGLLRLTFSLVSAVSLLLANFSWYYWEYGGVSNFTKPLTHLDSVYFAVGTLSTAGTGSLSATSETAIALQTAQMVLGLGLALFGFGVVVARYTAPLRLKPNPPAETNAQPGQNG